MQHPPVPVQVPASPDNSAHDLLLCHLQPEGDAQRAAPPQDAQTNRGATSVVGAEEDSSPEASPGMAAEGNPKSAQKSVLSIFSRSAAASQSPPAAVAAVGTSSSSADAVIGEKGTGTETAQPDGGTTADSSGVVSSPDVGLANQMSVIPSIAETQAGSAHAMRAEGSRKDMHKKTDELSNRSPEIAGEGASRVVHAHKKAQEVEGPPKTRCTVF